MSRVDRLSEFTLCASYPSTEPHSTHVQGHKVTYWNQNNSATDCLILLKFGTAFDHVTSQTLQIFNVNVSQVKVTESKVKVTE